MNDFWSAFVLAIGGNVVVLGAVAFLSKQLVTHWLDKDVERFKGKLRREADTELEHLRNALQITAAEHSILLSRLQDRRADVIDQVYGLLAQAIDRTTKYVAIFEFAGDPPREEKRKVAAEAIIAFRDYFEQKRIWLPSDCCEKVAALENGLRSIYNQFSLDRQAEQRGGHVNTDGWIKAWEAVTKDLVPPARTALETQMRGLLEPAKSGT